MEDIIKLIEKQGLQTQVRDYLLKKYPLQEEAKKVTINKLKVGMKKIYLKAQVVEIKDQFKHKKTGDPVAVIKIKDDTGECNLFVYGEDNIKKIQPGKTINLNDCYCSGEYEGFKDLTPGKFGKIEVV